MSSIYIQLNSRKWIRKILAFPLWYEMHSYFYIVLCKSKKKFNNWNDPILFIHFSKLRYSFLCAYTFQIAQLKSEYTSNLYRPGQPLSLASVQYWLTIDSTSDEHFYNSYLLGARVGAADRALFERATCFSCSSIHETFMHSCLSCTC